MAKSNAQRMREWREKYPERALANNRRYWKAHPEFVRDRHYKRTFGITVDQADAILKAQGSKCANPGCNQEIAPLSHGGTRRNHACLDHDHETGKIREFLCSGCNSALGMARESIDVISGLVQYLEKHK